MILTNGKVWTGHGFAGGLAIDGNRIAAVGKVAPRGGRVIDLRGRLAVPGFIDNHTHFIDGGMQLSRVQLRDAATPQEFSRRIAERAGGGKWITGGGWDHTLWSPPALPTRQLVAGVEGPVFVTRLDMHMGLANSRALELAGITRETPDPPGGTIVRDENGQPTGILKDAALSLIERVIPRATLDERVAAARAGLAEAARFGVTAFCDMSSADAREDLRAYEQLDRAGELTARLVLFSPILASHAPHVRAVKGFADGSLGSSTAAFFEPYADDPNNRGLLMEAMTNGRMKAAIADADARGLLIAIHAIGDRANDEVLRIFESMPRKRFRIEHAQHLSPSLVERFARAGVIASMQPHHAVDDERWAEGKIGRERMRWAYAFRALLDAGVTVTFGSDWTVAPLDPLLGVYAAVTHGVTVEEALRCYTANNAYAMRREDEIGRIAPGMLADIVVLSDDLFAVAPERIPEVKVDFTIFDGQTIYERSH